MGYNVEYIWHPTHKVTDLAACEKFFTDVFNLPSVSVDKNLPPKEECPDYPRDYTILTMIREVMFDCLDPQKYVVGGRQTLDDVDSPGHLFCFGLSVSGADELYHVLLENGIRSTDQSNRIGGKKEVPYTGFNKTTLYFTLPESAGFRYQIYATSGTSAPHPRVDPNWTLPPVSKTDPLGIEFCSFHTILSVNPERTLKFLVTLLKGKIIHRGRNETLETDSTYVSLGDSVFEVAVPTRPGSFAAEDLKFNAPYDTYSGLTFKVQDIAKVKRHLQNQKVPILVENAHTIVTDPKHSIGVPWGFTDVQLPGDDRTVPES